VETTTVWNLSHFSSDLVIYRSLGFFIVLLKFI